MVMTGVATPESALIARTRGGDMAAYDELYRRHVDEAVKVARIVCDDRDDVPDLVNEAFTRVLSRLTEGGGPDHDLGPYLRTIVRRLAVDRFHGERRHTSADPESLEVLPTIDDPIGRAADKHLVRTAFETLPERWQRVLWHTEIEGRSPASLASTLGMAPNAVAALAYRAREGLRQAYLTVNLPRKVAQECRRFDEKLPAYTRGTLPDDSVDVIAEHLTHCTDCRERRDDLLLLASDLRGLLVPALLVPATGWGLAATGVTAGGVAAGVTAGATSGGGLLAWLSPAKWGIAATGGSGGAVAGAATGGLAATVAAIAVFTAPFGGGSSAPDVISDPVAAPSLTVEGPISTREGSTGGRGPADADNGSALGGNTSGDAAADEDTENDAGEDTDGDADEKEEDKDDPRGAETEAPDSDPTPGPEPTDDPAPDPDPTSEPTDPPTDPEPDPEPTDPPTDPEPDPEPTEPDPEPTEPDPEPTDPEPDPDPDDGDEHLRIDVDLGLGDLLGIDIGLGGIVGIGIR